MYSDANLEKRQSERKREGGREGEREEGKGEGRRGRGRGEKGGGLTSLEYLFFVVFQCLENFCAYMIG